jgi:diaminohydroxyphosphoribosylaminopyrimidine deaminase / 5-amino-6-(5-phosphoribosylamino)uracil reductase
MEVAQHHEQFMQRAIELAKLGKGHVSPNPLVGCVIVHDAKIIAEGWHKKFGAAHAEVNAINALADKSILSQCTVYVNLEPCSHHGKTPPCADLLIQQQVKQVVIANIDPNPLVAGAGIQKLKDAGVKVIENILRDEGLLLNSRFFTSIQKHRPYIILKWAQTADGFMARTDFSSQWISNEQSRQLVHRWRSEEDAVMVGTNTAKYDNPQLNVRLWKGRNPVRIVVDRNLRLPESLHVFDKSQPTLCYNLSRQSQSHNLEYVKLESADFMNAMLRDMHQKGIQSVIIEGGAALLNDLINNGFWDEARVFLSKNKFENGIKAPALIVDVANTSTVGEDILQVYYFK